MDVKQAAYELKSEFARHAMLDRINRERKYNAELRRRIEIPEGRRKERERIEQFEAALTTPVQVATFKARLDTYDTATVEALMNNERQFAEIRERFQSMLLEAHVLPDGRRVFRTRDGKQVFDEHGWEVSPDTLKADAIDPRRPTWEDLQGARDQEKRIIEERDRLDQYQQKLDEARNKVNEGNLTKEELDQLGKELEKSMPKPVREVVQRNDAQCAQIDSDLPTPATASSPDSLLSTGRDAVTGPPLPAGMR